jgi:hypothetical protein
MDASQFDRITRLFAARRSRRQALAGGGAGLAAAALAATGRRAAAQDATSPSGSAKSETDPKFLFVQSFQSGGFAPKDGGGDSFTLALADGLGQTVYFSDRPDRVVGASPTAKFLKNFSFGAANPPNAALVLETAPGDTDVVVMELTAPAYDEATKTATYAAKVLTDYEKLGVTFQERPKGPAEVHAEFGAASLFIDDCPDGSVDCYDGNNNYLGNSGTIGFCYHYLGVCCFPCGSSSNDSMDPAEDAKTWATFQCNNTWFPAQCQNGNCTADISDSMLCT